MNGCIVGGIYFGSLGGVRMMLNRDDLLTWGLSGGISGYLISLLFHGKVKMPIITLGMCGLNMCYCLVLLIYINSHNH